MVWVLNLWWMGCWGDIWGGWGPEVNSRPKEFCGAMSRKKSLDQHFDWVPRGGKK